jgi:adenylate cyclase
MSVALGLGLGFFVLTAVGSVLGIGLVSGYRNTVTLLHEKAELLVAAEVNQVKFYFDAAQAQVDFVAEQIDNGDIEPGPNEEFTSLLLGAIAATPQIVRIQYVNARGKLVGAERIDEQVAPLFGALGDDKDVKTLITEANRRRKPFWGKLLWRQEYKQATLNYHRPVIQNGETIGVVSVLISVYRLSELISDLETDFGANAFILYGPDSVLAHPMMAFGYPDLHRMQPLPKQAAFTDPVITTLWQVRDDQMIEEMMLSGPGIRFVRLADQAYIVLYKQIEGYTDRPLYVGTHFDSVDMMSEIFRLKWAIISCLVISVFSSFFAAYLGRRISLPVRRLAEGSAKVHQMELENVEPIPGSFFKELNEAANSFNAMLDGLRWFERYVPKSLVANLIRIHRDRGVESEYREICIMFTDIVKFATLSETMTAPAAAEFLNHHFTIIADKIEKEGGTVDKFIGDGVMAIWGAPEMYFDSADRTCKAALAIREAIEAHNDAQREIGGPVVQLRIGLHVGQVIVGNIGSPGRINYTIVGDPANVANRIEEMGREIGDTDQDVNILMSGEFGGKLKDDYQVKSLGEQALRGRSRTIEVFNVTGPPRNS